MNRQLSRKVKISDINNRKSQRKEIFKTNKFIFKSGVTLSEKSKYLDVKDLAILLVNKLKSENIDNAKKIYFNLMKKKLEYKNVDFYFSIAYNDDDFLKNRRFLLCEATYYLN